MQRNLPQVQGNKGKEDQLMVQTRCKAMHHMRHLHKVGRVVVSVLRIHAKKQAQGQPVQAEVSQKYVTLRKFWTKLDISGHYLTFLDIT